MHKRTIKYIVSCILYLETPALTTQPSVLQIMTVHFWLFTGKLFKNCFVVSLLTPLLKF